MYVSAIANKVLCVVLRDVYLSNRMSCYCTESSNVKYTGRKCSKVIGVTSTPASSQARCSAVVPSCDAVSSVTRQQFAVAAAAEARRWRQSRDIHTNTHTYTNIMHWNNAASVAPAPPNFRRPLSEQCENDEIFLMAVAYMWRTRRAVIPSVQKVSWH